MIYHKPVLLKECIEGLNIKPNGIYVDVTFGGGGHSKEILKYLPEGKLFAFDRDYDTLKNVPSDKNFKLIDVSGGPFLYSSKKNTGKIKYKINSILQFLLDISEMISIDWFFDYPSSYIGYD